jgi:hypothetical protein
MGTKLSKKSGTKTELRNKANPDTSIYIKWASNLFRSNNHESLVLQSKLKQKSKNIYDHCNAVSL